MWWVKIVMCIIVKCQWLQFSQSICTGMHRNDCEILRDRNCRPEPSLSLNLYDIRLNWQWIEILWVYYKPPSCCIEVNIAMGAQVDGLDWNSCACVVYLAESWLHREKLWTVENFVRSGVPECKLLSLLKLVDLDVAIEFTWVIKCHIEDHWRFNHWIVLQSKLDLEAMSANHVRICRVDL